MKGRILKLSEDILTRPETRDLAVIQGERKDAINVFFVAAIKFTPAIVNGVSNKDAAFLTNEIDPCFIVFIARGSDDTIVFRKFDKMRKTDTFHVLFKRVVPEHKAPPVLELIALSSWVNVNE